MTGHEWGSSHGGLFEATGASIFGDSHAWGPINATLESMGNDNWELEAMHVAKMAKAARRAHHKHACQMLDTMVDLIDFLEIDWAIPPSFGEWRLKAVKKACIEEMAPTYRQPADMW